MVQLGDRYRKGSIYRAIAIALAQAGATTIINFISSEKQAQEVQQKIL